MTRGTTPARRGYPSRVAGAAAAILAAILLAPPPPLSAAPTPAPDGRQEQTVDPNQREDTGRVVLEGGHVDIGPHYRGGTWTVRVHDDTVVPSVWRQPSDVVIRVRDSAVLPIPDDEAYAFLGQRPGTPVYVIPQTQNRDVVWVGWNTQDPRVMEAIQRGVTMKLTGVQGPGSLVVYLQSGNLGAPQVLWDSTKTLPQDLWVDTNTHTHANWVFATPGVYLVALEISADLADGRSVRSTGVLRFAIGDATGTDAAFAAAFPMAGAPSPAAGTAAPSPAPSAGAGPPAEEGGLPPATVATVVTIVVGLVLVGVVIGVLVRGGRAKRRAEAERAAGRTGPVAGQDTATAWPEDDR
ncbi:putative ABC transporter-associated repeat protein [Micromonospora pisi]|uniref:Putative ABC transporter-associated repeat protein n=1 Tax=Micromonospora pisi TaxID=589240 RepID=A0A495JEN4_9ACTN|nr:TIGR03773 family transporter-associated surface protein [Micromonospora pisi]RKR86844.1 putative ABC transporter-associated repeat protein [Micromonospora pisi]